MTRSVWLVLPLIALGFSQLVPPSTAQLSTADDSAEIARLRQAIADAMKRRDSAALSALLTDDFTWVSPRGRLMQKEIYVRNRAVTPVVVTPGTVQDLDVTIRVYGSAAVVTSRHVRTGSMGRAGPGALQDISGEYAVTETWVKLNGQWRQAAVHLSPIGFTGAHEATETGALRPVNGDELQWADSPDYPGARFAILAGTSYAGPYVVRLRRPNGHVEEPHYHESDEYLSVLSGVVHVGVGDSVERAKTKTVRSGGFVVIPARTLHYSWAEGDVVAEIHWAGPAAPTYPRGIKKR